MRLLRLRRWARRLRQGGHHRGELRRAERRPARRGARLGPGLAARRKGGLRNWGLEGAEPIALAAKKERSERRARLSTIPSFRCRWRMLELRRPKVDGRSRKV